MIPYVAIPPAGGERSDAAVVVAYHLLDPPRTEAAFAAAVPLDGLDAWRLYVGLPLSGDRLPAGGDEELWRLVAEDPVRNVHAPVALGALDEFATAFATARSRLGIADTVPVGVMGGSLGGAAAQLVLAEGGVPIRAAVLINPVVRLRDTIDGLSALHDTTYAWAEDTAAIADRMDFVRRAPEIRGAAIRYITGADDMVDAIIKPVEAVVSGLTRLGATVDRQVVSGMAHALADEPGTEPAAQTPHAAAVDRLAVEWFRTHLTGS